MSNDIFGICPKLIRCSGASKKVAFSDKLAYDADQLVITPIVGLSSIGVGPDGLLNKTYKWTWPALHQLFSICGSGIYSYIKTIADTEHPTASDPDKTKHVAGLFNRVVEFNLHKLIGSKLVLSKSDRTVDGVIGRSFVMVYNSSVFDAAVEMASCMSGSMVFVDGTLIGRDMNVMFANRKPFVNVAKARLNRGLIVQNRETGGRAIRLANAIYDSITESYSVDVFTKDTRIPHVMPSKVIGKMMQLADAIVARQQKPDEISKKFSLALTTRLANKWNDETKDKFTRTTLSRLAKWEIPASAAEMIVSTIVTQNGAIPTRFDVYSAMLKIAKLFSESSALKIRQAAFVYLFWS